MDPNQYRLRNRDVSATRPELVVHTLEGQQSDVAEVPTGHASAGLHTQISVYTGVVLGKSSSVAVPETEVVSEEKTLRSDTPARPAATSCSDIFSPPVLTPIVTEPMRIPPIRIRRRARCVADTNPTDSLAINATAKSTSGSHTVKLARAADSRIPPQLKCLD